ncbi:MAG: mismatch-specific DNA-glycosylase [Ornithinimicrobium sp.]|uniref:mismatch-specific DNA-glycosylase n=1 Tax=Ornithinimicrobium sp. TaxID=1977084 RepID=UPI0026DF8C9F|nr:mismatch-specific DNA-glycosylase [Ornithinimicrobium sp.]MDO5740345.1 mismatch-specific DNA-glycosylase [Ornithinimicrobium sp.]
MARFTRAELDSFRGSQVPDLAPGPGSATSVRLLFVGINPGLWTAAVQTHFAHPASRFYPALLRAGIIGHPVYPADGMSVTHREHLLGRGIAITNLVRQATARADELSATQLRAGVDGLRETVRRLQPVVVAVLGITAFRIAFAEHKAVVGRQPGDLEGAQLWVLPNPSGLNAHETIETLAFAYAEPARSAGIELNPMPRPPGAGTLA